MYCMDIIIYYGLFIKTTTFALTTLVYVGPQL